MSTLQKSAGILAALVIATAIGGCTTTDQYAAYKKEFAQGAIDAGAFKLMTGNPSLSGKLYYARLTNENGIWSSELSDKQFNRTNEHQELFVVDPVAKRIKPDFVSARGDSVVVPNKYESALCPPDFLSAELKKRRYTVCTTAFALSRGSVNWEDMARAVSTSDLADKVLNWETARIKREADDAERKKQQTAAAKVAAEEAAGRQEAQKIIRTEAAFRARALQCGPTSLSGPLVRDHKKYMSYRYDGSPALRANFKSNNEVEQQLAREMKVTAHIATDSCAEDMRSLKQLQTARNEEMAAWDQVKRQFKAKEKSGK